MADKTSYTIIVGDFVVGETTYENRCLSASLGGQGIKSDTIPWAGTEYNPWDYKYEKKKFVLDAIELPEVVEELSQLDMLEAQLTYTAVSSGTLISAEEDELADKIDKWHKAGAWSDDMVGTSVEKGKVTAAAYKTMTGKDYDGEEVQLVNKDGNVNKTK